MTPATLPLYQVDAFASEVFRGNPAAVCPLREWLPDTMLQAIAEENNLAETAFFVAAGDGWELRWFTPRHEVPLCGHATLASAYVLLRHLQPELSGVCFSSASGELRVSRDGELFTLDFPAMPASPCDEVPEALLRGADVSPQEVLVVEEDPNLYVVLERRSDVAALEPDLGAWEALHPYGVVVTAPGDPDDEVDFVSRYFAPSYGIPEDPVTGSIHCALAPYWAGRLGRRQLRARQLSRRGGELLCRVEGERVMLSGPAVLYLRGEITVPSHRVGRCSPSGSRR